MKFQKLTIHNIASIEDAVIDFEAHPLVDSEVFLITGKTGAGKSTILDAICLALYADTPRLENTKMQGEMQDGRNQVRIADPRQLMRRNTGEAYVSLTFTGSNGVHYEATWSVARARKKPDGNMQSKDWQLKNLDTSYTLNKDREITAEIRAAIGLDFNQFCRTTLLAQGEFTRFLNSRDDEKAEILEKITGVDIYSKIGAKIYETTGQKQELWKTAKSLVEGIHLLEEHEIEERKNTLMTLGKQMDALKAESDKVAGKRDWMRLDNELSRSVEKATEELRAARETVESEEFKTRELLVKDWNATIDARSWWNEVQKAAAAQERQQKALEKLSATFAELSGGQQYAEQEVGKLTSDIAQIDTFLTREAEKASVYENAQTIAVHLGTIEEGRKTIEKNHNIIVEENKSLVEQLSPTHEKAKQATLEARNALEKEEADVKAKEDAVTALNLMGLRDQRDAAKDLLAKINTARVRIETFTAAKEKREMIRQQLSDRQARLNSKMEESAQMDGPLHDAELTMKVRKEDLDKQSMTINEFANTLRQELKVGDICPICRQTIVSELPHEEELAALVGGLKNAYDEAEKEYKRLYDAKVKLDAEIKSESESLKRDTKALEVDTSVSQAEQKAREAYSACGIEQPNDSALQILAALEEHTSAQKNSLETKINEGEAQEKAVKKLRRALETKRKNLETLAQNETSAGKAVSDCKARIATAEALVETKRKEVEKAEFESDALITAGNWEVDWKEAPKDFASRLKTAATAYNVQQKNKQALMSRLETAKANVENVGKVMQAILAQMPTWSGLQSTVGTKVENLLTKANTINTSVATALAQMKTAEDSQRTYQTKLEDFVAHNQTITMERLVALNAYTLYNITREDASLKEERNNVVAKETLLKKAKEQQGEHQQKKPALAEEETLEVLAAQKEDYEKLMGEINQRKGAINQELKADMEDKERRGALVKDAEQKEADYKQWSRINQMIGDATGNKFRKIAQSYVLSSLIHSANSYMKTLTDRYTLKVVPGTFVISIEDAYQGYVSRPTSTISGGESFLVSLSLALALSDIGQTLSVDTLFIDEGFGTLSGEPLQNAINTLRTLHNKVGRHVGIISHVEELQERIPVQIQVNQEGNNSSSQVVIVN